MTTERAKPIRCAIYTRKSSEEGLDQAFNSLHAQREACEAYVKSQSHEGWRASAKTYDDGGLSGGHLERPALQRLLADVDSGLVDTIVVYKIDRLTRSLADFARIVERLEAKGASFVAVTQAFNTTTSMGRLTLNVLLSFAQFEREVTAERIRDKIKASKQKGMWMGGSLPLGYEAPTDLSTRALVINPDEAKTVVSIFQAYLRLRSVASLEAHLAAIGVRSKLAVSKARVARGGVRFSRGTLYHLLQNRTYLGEIPHGDETYPGAHQAIVSAELFQAVQDQLASQRRRIGSRSAPDAAPLTGKLFDIDGEPMSPTFTHHRSGRVYRYYVSGPLQKGQKRRAGDPTCRRLAAPQFEEILAQELRELLGQSEAALRELISAVRRIDLEPEGVRLTLLRSRLPRAIRQVLEAHSDGALGVRFIPLSPRWRGGRTWIDAPDGVKHSCRRDPVLVRGLHQAHALAAGFGWRMADGTFARLDAHSPSNTHLRRLCRLAFLAPDLQQTILEGRQPPWLTLDALLKSPISPDWSQQRRLFARS